MPDAVILADVGDLIEVVNWSALGKWALLAIALPLIWIVAIFFAKKKVQVLLEDREAQLRNRVHAAEVDQGKIASRDESIIRQAQTIAHQAEALKLKESQLIVSRERIDFVFEEGKKEFKRAAGLEKYRLAFEQLRKKSQDDDRRIAILEAKLVLAGGETGQLMEDLQARRVAIAKAENRLRRARKLDGYFWQAKALQRRPKFRPLSERKTAIVSVLNLKGGVGKTTTVAQLGAEFARRGYRVLCVDLDLQGSLSTLLLDQQSINEGYGAKRLLQHYFKATGAGANPRIADFAREVPSPEGRAGSLHVLPTTDDLAFAEFNLTVGWLLRSGERDARFLLRQGLHAKSVAHRFDLVLLDCPPLLNISCINALAASDYLLIPALPSATSLERVLNLLRTTRSTPFLTHVNQNLNLLGLLANRTHHSGLTRDDRREWELLAQKIQNLFGIVPKKFETDVPQLKGILDGDTVSATSRPNPSVEAIYGRLALELERILPHDCRRTAAVLPQLV